MTLLYKAFVSCIHIVKTNKQTHLIYQTVCFLYLWLEHKHIFLVTHSHIMHMDEQAKKKNPDRSNGKFITNYIHSRWRVTQEESCRLRCLARLL